MRNWLETHSKIQMIFANNFNIKFRNGKIGWHLWYNFYAGHINDLINLLILQTTYSVRKASLFMTFITHLWCCGAVYSKLWIWALIGWIWGGGGRSQPPHHAPQQAGGQCKSSLVIFFLLIWALIGWIWGGGGRDQPPHHAPQQTGGQCKSSLVILFIDLFVSSPFLGTMKNIQKIVWYHDDNNPNYTKNYSCFLLNYCMWCEHIFCCLE